MKRENKQWFYIDPIESQDDLGDYILEAAMDQDLDVGYVIMHGARQINLYCTRSEIEGFIESSRFWYESEVSIDS